MDYRRESVEAVESIFKAFALHYGPDRMAAKWNGLDPVDAKAYWAGKLGVLSLEAVRYAMGNLPQHPPTVDEFIEIARRYRPPEQPQQLRLGSPKDDEHGRQRINEIAKWAGSKAVSG